MIGTSKSVWGFDPRSVPGCQLWLDAADASTVTLSGSNVTRWIDKSGTGNNYSNSGTITYTNNSVYFNGSSDMINTSPLNFSIGTNPSMSTFMIFSYVNSASLRGLFQYGLVTCSKTGYVLYINMGKVNASLYCGDLSVNNTVPANVTTIVSDVVTYTGTSGSLTRSGWVNGAPMSVTNVSTTGVNLNLNSISTLGNTAYNEPFLGYISEVIYYNQSLTTSQRQQVEGYLAHKWGLQTSIPSTHPFYSIRPHLRAFQPIDVPGCALWLDAADQSSLTLSGSNVTQWSDKSGNGNTVIQATSANQPTYVTNVVNGNPVLRFNGTSHVLQTTSFTSLGTNSVSFWLVERNLSNSGGGGAPFSFNSGPNNGIVFQNNNGLQPLPTSVPYTSSVARIVFYNRTNTGSGDSGYLNGTVVSIRDDNTTGTYGTTFAVGMRILSTIYTSGDICEILIFIGMPTVSERQQVEGYLAHKWGLSPTYASNTPLTIPGCQLWLDAADSSTTTSITSGIWTDKSGNSYNTSYVSGGSGFTLGTINGLSAVTFPGGSNKVITTSVPTSTSTGFSIFFIASRSSSSGTNTRYIANLTSSLQIYTVSGTNTIASYVGATFPSTSLSISTGVPFILSLTVSSSTFSQWINGIANSSTGSTVSTSGSTIVIGGSGSYTTDLVFAGQIGEVIIFNTTLSTTQRQTVEGYLAKKWGLTVSGQFPSTHPFKSFPPASLPFSPRNISGLALWLDAADQSSMTLSGSSVTVWNDKSGNGKNATAGGTTPTYSSATRSIVFGGAGYFTNSSLSLPLSTRSVFIVCTQTSRAGDFEGIVILVNPLGSDVDYASPNAIPYSASGSNPLQTGAFTLYGNNGTYIQNYGSYTTTPLGIYVDVFGSSSGTLYVNGTSNSTDADSSTLGTANGYILGARKAGSSTTLGIFFNGTISEVIIYNTAVTTSQRQQIEGYLAQKWGLTGSLPSSHPFKKLPA